MGKIDAQPRVPSGWAALSAGLLLAQRLIAGCTDRLPITPTESVTPTSLAPAPLSDDRLYVALIWHQHQPVYFQDPQTGLYARPWVRVHAAKDYLDMVTMIEAYPEIRATFNLTPSLIRQLDDLAAGARDLYWAMAEIDAGNLTRDEKRFLLERFFDINPLIIRRFPRYIELERLRRGSDPTQIDAALATWQEQDFRDLQVLFNLAWTDPDWLAQEPLLSLVAKGRDYSEADKQVLFEEHLRLIREVIPAHARLQDAGQIEVTMTPFAHPILPLLVDTNLAAVAMPDAELPDPFRYGQDAVAQVDQGVAFYRDHFGRDPRGMWPAEGSVAPVIVGMVARAGIQWMASDEEVLAASLPDLEAFTRDASDTVQQADALYRPYTVSGRGGDVAILFRDHLISDKVGFEYSGMAGEQAAADLLQRLDAIRARLQSEGAEGPHLVTVLLDGENAWEYYENDGKDFLHALYRGLTESESLTTITPSEFLARAPAPRAIDDLWAGSWIDHSFGTWIGEEEENLAWEYLGRTRADLEESIRTGLEPEVEREALQAMYIAEGSDWFWWYGVDQSSGSDDDFDDQFRSYLSEVYRTIHQEPPAFLSIPIIPQTPVDPDQPLLGASAPTVDGLVQEQEWELAARFDLGGEAAVSTMYYAFDSSHLYLRLDGSVPFQGATETDIQVYLRSPEAGDRNPATRDSQRAVGFGISHLWEIDPAGSSSLVFHASGGGGWISQGPVGAVAARGTTLEASLPLASLAQGVGIGDRFQLRVELPEAFAGNGTLLPEGGPVLMALPDLPLPHPILEVSDPVGDDHGPGAYTYPTDRVFAPGVFDLIGGAVGYDEERVMIRVALSGPINNHWGSPNGLSAQTIDVYIDTDGPGSGSRLMLPGRNAAFTSDFAWDLALWAEGWTPGVYRPSADGPVEQETELLIATNPGQRQITLSFGRDDLPGDPSEWSYAIVLLGQEGFPATGVWRVRDVNPAAEQWRFGGAPADTNHTRIIDILWPAGLEPTQEAMLTLYPASQQPVGELGAEGFAQVPMLKP